MSNLLYLAFFVTFVAIILAIRVRRDRRAVMALVFYVLAVHAVLAATRREAWPFVTHGVFLENGDEHRAFMVPRFVGIDQSGREHRIDARSWAPIHDRTLSIWWLIHFRRLTPEEKNGVMAFLLHKGESARATMSGEFLQSLRAPSWYSIELPPPRSSNPFVGLRVDLITRIAAQKLASGAESSQVLARFP